ncbi:MAG: hypothetical protein HKO62_07475 [Gammaproteobacteria bacterium]|nr:hypothetical protein [Gammaproteobacteria bacterium]
MSESAVLLEVDARGVAAVTLNRPDRHNAFDDAMIGELTTIFTALAARGDVRAMVLGARGASFSAGADLAWMQRMAAYGREENLRDANLLADMLAALWALPVATIASVQGSAFGGGVGLVSCCDIAIGATDARFALSEVRLGLAPATIGPYVIDAIGPRAARRYFQSAERFSAARAAELGLLSEVVAAAELEETVASVVDAVVAGGPDAVRAAKRLVADLAGQPITADLRADTSVRIADLRASDEGREGLAAFLEKRRPAWRPGD